MHSMPTDQAALAVRANIHRTSDRTHKEHEGFRAGAAVQVGWEAKAYICPLEAHVEQHILHVVSMRPTAELCRRC